MFEQTPCSIKTGDALLFMAFDVIKLYHTSESIKHKLPRSYLCTIFLQPHNYSFPPSVPLHKALFVCAFLRRGRAQTNPETRFALMLVFAKNDESVSDWFIHVPGNSEEGTGVTLENYFKILLL